MNGRTYKFALFIVYQIKVYIHCIKDGMIFTFSDTGGNLFLIKNSLHEILQTGHMSCFLNGLYGIVKEISRKER